MQFCLKECDFSRDGYALFDVILAMATSFFAPGVGQIFQRKYLRGILYFLFMPVFYVHFLPLAVLIHCWSVIDGFFPNLRFKNTKSKVLQHF